MKILLLIFFFLEQCENITPDFFFFAIYKYAYKGSRTNDHLHGYMDFQ